MNSITGIKPVLLVGTISKNKIPNISIFNSVVHISSNPSLIGFFVRDNKSVRRDTLSNIISTHVYTLNHINSDFIHNAHATSAKLNSEISEFEYCGLEEEYIENFSAPFCLKSNIKLGLFLKEIVDLECSESKLVVGEINHVIINDDFINNDYSIDLQKSNSISSGGLNNYYQNLNFVSLPYIKSH